MLHHMTPLDDMGVISTPTSTSINNPLSSSLCSSRPSPRLPPPPPPPSFFFSNMPRGIHSLPTELLAEFFSFASPNSEGSVALSHVCRKFRSVALSSPVLWTTVNIGVWDRFSHQDESYPLIRLFLQRARTHPLCITIDVRQPQSRTRALWSDESIDENWFGSRDMELVCEVLMIGTQHLEDGSGWEVIKRWKAIHLFVDSWSPMYTFLHRTAAICAPHSDATLPVMRDVQLSRDNMYHAEVYHFNPFSLVRPIKLFGGVSLPGLKEIILDGVHVDWWPLVKSLYKETVTRGEALGTGLERLSLRYHSGEVLPPQGVVDALLYGSRNTLKDLCLACSGPATTPSPHFGFDPTDDILDACLPPTDSMLSPRTPLLLPVLEEFTLRFFKILYAFNIFRCLDIPACKTLHIADDSRLSEDMEDAPGVQPPMSEMIVLTFFRQHQSFETGALKNVTFTGMPYLALPLGRSIWSAKALQSVENLTLRVVPLDILDLESLDERFVNEKPPTLPNLRNLSIRNCEGSGVIWPSNRKPDEDPTILRLLPILKRHTGLERISYYHKDLRRLPSDILDSIAEHVDVASWAEEQEVEDEEGVHDSEPEDLDEYDPEFEDGMQDIEWNDSDFSHAHATPTAPTHKQEDNAPESTDEWEAESSTSGYGFGCPGDASTSTSPSMVPSLVLSTGTSLYGDDEFQEGVVGMWVPEDGEVNFEVDQY